ncbi:MAG: D-alanyl-D-alanine carboxypeptidase [Candidatus Nealsonbacteria bacterium]|nr:D-alanyl-D-alanine carboxypeptidase [Candidatus Nealsonbacteria bacterium]
MKGEETKRLRFFFIGLGISLVFFGFLNAGELRLEKFLFGQLYLPQETFLAQASRPNLFQKLDIKARSALVVKVESDGQQTVLFDKNSSQPLAIASLTKLMTAVVSLENQPLSKEVEISPSSVSQEGSSGNLKAGERIMVKELLKMALVESSNDAAEALAEVSGRKEFINLMNRKARELSLRSTHFSTPTGLEAEDNFSTARDLVNLTIFILKDHPFILEISAQPSVIILSENDRPHHRAFNTNELLLSLAGIENWKIVGGKTGYTDEAGGGVILVTKDRNGDYFINLVLGADSHESRFSELKKLVQAFN